MRKKIILPGILGVICVFLVSCTKECKCEYQYTLPEDEIKTGVRVVEPDKGETCHDFEQNRKETFIADIIGIDKEELDFPYGVKCY